MSDPVSALLKSLLVIGGLATATPANLPDDPQRAIICAPGYALNRRPPEEITERIKRRLAREQHVSVRCCELDHIVPLCLGGEPLDLSNLQLQPWVEARKKDEKEKEACRAYCAREIDLPTARKRFHRTSP